MFFPKQQVRVFLYGQRVGEHPAARVLEPGSKLATWRMLQPQCATHSLAAVLELAEVELDAVYQALD